jgi:hypothetical protein
MSRPYLIFWAALSMLAPEHLPAAGRNSVAKQNGNIQ